MSGSTFVAHPASYQIGTRGFIVGGKLTTHLHPVLRLRMHGAHHPQYICMACCLVKHRDNFTIFQNKCDYITTQCEKKRNLLHACSAVGSRSLHYIKNYTFVSIR
jgi:hypothetical protein